MASLTYDVGSVLAQSAARSARSAFELQFSQMQNTIIRRLNKEIEKVNTFSSAEQRKVDTLEKKSKDLQEALPVMESYRIGVSNTQSQLVKFREQIATMLEAFGGDTDVDQSEVDAVLARKAELRETLNNMPVFKHDDIADGDVIARLRKELATIDSWTPVVGTKQDNEDMILSVFDLDDKVNTAQLVTANTLATVVDLEQGMQTKLAEVQTGLTEMNTVVQAEKIAEVDKLKQRYATLLESLSMTFEFNQTTVETMASYLSPTTPEKGSVLNLFS